MDTTNTASQPRMLSIDEFATLSRSMREAFRWSQETLAGLNVRKVQHIENAISASINSNAFLPANGLAPPSFL